MRSRYLCLAWIPSSLSPPISVDPFLPSWRTRGHQLHESLSISLLSQAFVSLPNTDHAIIFAFSASEFSTFRLWISLVAPIWCRGTSRVRASILMCFRCLANFSCSSRIVDRGSFIHQALPGSRNYSHTANVFYSAYFHAPMRYTETHLCSETDPSRTHNPQIQTRTVSSRSGLP